MAATKLAAGVIFNSEILYGALKLSGLLFRKVRGGAFALALRGGE